MLTRDQVALEPIELVVVQGTSFCNLNCKYCYLSESTRRNRDRILPARLSSYFGKILSSRFLRDKLIVSWHSGEPLILGVDYYESAIQTIKDLAMEIRGPKFAIIHDFQTNGTLIDNDWCDFFKKYQDTVTVGVSCDGPPDMHDAYRRGWGGEGLLKERFRESRG